jgi:hypothetical protein
MTAHDARTAPTQPPARRRRAWPWMAAIACALVGWYLWRAASLWYARPVIALDFVKTINERQPQPGPEGSAFVIYREAFGDGVKPQSDVGSDALDFAWRAAVDPAALAGLRQEMADAAPRLAALRKLPAHSVLATPMFHDASEHPEIATLMGYPTDEASRPKPPTHWFMRVSTGLSIPSARLSRWAISFLFADATLATLDGDIDRAIANLEAAAGAASHGGESGFPFAGVSQASTEGSVAASVVSIVENHGETLSDRQLQALERMVGRLAMANDERVLETARLEMLDMVQRIYSDDGAGNGELLPQPMQEFQSAFTRLDPATQRPRPAPWQQSDAAMFLLTPITNRWRDDRTTTMRRFDRILALVREGLTAPSGDALGKLERRIDQILELTPAWEQPLISNFGAGWTMTLRASRTVRLGRDAALAAIGIERFRRVNARFPESLDELNGFVGSKLGADNPPSNPWRYAVVDGRPLIYDFGVDGVDDGARPAAAFLNEVRGDEAQQSPWGTRSTTCASLSASVSVHAEPPQPKDGVWPALQPVVLGELCDPTTRTTQPATTMAPEARFGDTVWVLWRSGASGPSRLVRLEPDNGELGAVPEDG